MDNELAKQGQNLVDQLKNITNAGKNNSGETSKAHAVFKKNLAAYTALVGKHNPLVIKLNDLSDKVGVVAINNDPTTYL